MRKILFFASLLAANLFNAQAYLDDIMLQSFGWDEYNQASSTSNSGFYNYIKSQSANFKAAGFDMIWLPPPSNSSGGVGYMPRELYNFSSTVYGTQAQLTAMLSQLKSDGIHPIADVVVNHRVGSTNWNDFTNPSWSCGSICVTDEGYTNPSATGTKPCGDADTGDDFNGARDLNHKSTEVQNGIKQYLSLMQGLGFEGWRWDMVKGFAGYYVGLYNTSSQPYYSVGEYWDGNINSVKGWIDATSSGGYKSGAFDFPLYYTLGSAIKTNNYSSLAGQVPGVAGQYGYSQYGVTFVDNHDTFVKPEYFAGDDIIKGYAYILTHPGIPCVFICHYKGGTYSKDGVTRTYSSYADIINTLMKIRKNNGINAFSSLNVKAAQSDLYAAEIDGKVAVKFGNTSWSPTGTGWNLAASYINGFVKVWTKTATSTPTLSVSPASGTFNSGTNVSVTMSASDALDAAPKIYYTLDGTSPSSSSTLYTAPVSISTNKTVKAVAVNNQGNSSQIVTNQYTFVTLSSFTVYFKPPTTWTAAPKVYYWNSLPAGSLANSTWPGVTMNAACDGWYYYNFNGISSTNIIFDNGNSGVGTNQTADLTASATSYYDWASKSWLSTAPITNPCINISPNGGANISNVTITAVDAVSPNPTIYYTTDGTTPTTASASATNSVSLNLTKTTTVNAFAKSASGSNSAVKSATFTFSGITARFKPDPTAAGWNGVTPKVYYWNVVGGSVPATSWPGVNMISEGNGWFYYTFPNVTSLNLIFDNGNSGVGTNQTSDITGVTQNIWYDWKTKVVSTTPLSRISSPKNPSSSEDYVQLYPIPAKETLNIKSGYIFSRYSVYDAAGKIALQGTISSNQIKVKELPSGTYYVKLMNDEGKISLMKFIKE